MIIEIISKENQHIKVAKQLLLKKYRSEYKKFLIEGVKIIKDAIWQHNIPISEIIINQSFNHVDNPWLSNFNTFRVSDKIFKDICDTQHSQGICAIAPILDPKLTDTDSIVYCDSISDPGNLGTIIRTAAAAGIGQIILSPTCVDPYNPKTVRATMGSIFSIPISISEEYVLSELRNKNFKVISGTVNGKQHIIYEIDFKKPVILVIGNESRGISPYVENQTDYFVNIPMLGKAESLNAAVAGSILIYELVRQRYFGK